MASRAENRVVNLAGLVQGITFGDLSARLPLTSQRLKEDEDRPKYNSNAAGYSTDGVCGGHRLRNQIEQKKAHHQEDDEPLDPSHVVLLILPVFTSDYSNALPHVQAEASILPPLPHLRWRRKAITNRRADLVGSLARPARASVDEHRWRHQPHGGRERLGPPYVLPHLPEVAERLDAMTLMCS